jgi:hypothetical protein
MLGPNTICSESADVVFALTIAASIARAADMTGVHIAGSRMNDGGVKSRNSAAAAIIVVALVACGRPTGVVDSADHSTPRPTTSGTTILPPTPTFGVVPEDFVAEPGSLAYRYSNSGQTYLLSLLQRSSQQVSPGSSPEVLGLGHLTTT